jgi:hypothetical protein
LLFIDDFLESWTVLEGRSNLILLDRLALVVLHWVKFVRNVRSEHRRHLLLSVVLEEHKLREIC